MNSFLYSISVTAPLIFIQFMLKDLNTESIVLDMGSVLLSMLLTFSMEYGTIQLMKRNDEDRDSISFVTHFVWLASLAAGFFIQKFIATPLQMTFSSMGLMLTTILMMSLLVLPAVAGNALPKDLEVPSQRY